MKNVLFVAPFESNGRYKGGIMNIANAVFTKSEIFRNSEINLVKFNMNFKKRKNFSVGKMSFENVKHFMLTIKKMINDIKKNDCEIIYYNTSKALGIVKDAVVINIVKKFMKDIKIILHIHFAEYEKIMPRKKWLEKYIFQIFIKKVDGFVFLSEKTKDEFVEKGIDSEKSFVLYNFHNFDISNQFVNRKIEKFKNKDYLEVLFMGTIDRRKGIIDLLDSLKNCTIPYKLHICGICNDDTMKAEFDQKIKDFGNSVILHGYTENNEKEEILKSSDLMILPTYGEGFPVVLVEGMAFACSIISTPVGAIPEFILNKDNGYLVNPGDIGGFEKAIEKVFKCKDITISQMNLNYQQSKAFLLDNFVNKQIGIISNF